MNQHKRTQDWKDIASSYYDKAMSLAILLLLFSFMVSPKIEVKPYERKILEVTKLEEIPEIREEIKPPEQQVKPVIDIVIEDDLSDDDEDIEIIDTIEKTELDVYEEEIVTNSNEIGTTPKFVFYEDPPVPIKQIKPVYSDFAKRMNITGDVVLEVEVLIDGSVGAINVLHSLMPGPDGLDEAAVNAVKQWEFKPAQSGGKPVAVWVQFPVGFGLD